MTSGPRGFDVSVSDRAKAEVAELSPLERFRYERGYEQLFLDPTPRHPLVYDLRGLVDEPGDFVLRLVNVAIYFNRLNALVSEVVSVRAD